MRNSSGRSREGVQSPQGSGEKGGEARRANASSVIERGTNRTLGHLQRTRIFTGEEKNAHDGEISRLYSTYKKDFFRQEKKQRGLVPNLGTGTRGNMALVWEGGKVGVAGNEVTQHHRARKA